ncbi:hypothetical protein PC9H_005814 [Pleurotus ostreatus]|uniref:Uncharacterized protein n=1 Tax=Pleurotus ostreatus TaxID=5322 RepID=A0A8H7A1B6_PLEOS|nr:uncharacterized protein PC9H_005814 [Pleurotus ostreatus]KAF7433848.1 hypothetical protein PC9H_005814 [Pleurotus ostreatus]KAJ8697348.1 hypothetical protein PTI98_004158 [Pleurotus ostreatus]
MINKQQINSSHLHSFLVLLDGEDDKSIQALIDPADHQNVPRAMKLMVTISRLQLLGTSCIRPIDQPILNALLALDDLLRAFYEPFVIPSLSLGEQLASLAKFAFLAFAHHRLHGTGFMTNQLYADLQGVVKTAFFNVAKQKEVDSSKPFYLYQQGSDRLEQMIGDVRTMSHDQNVDVLQLCERLSDCIDVNHIFARHPDWKGAHRRLSYTGTEGVDHVNTWYFTGNLIVNDVDLDSAWKSGQIEAELALQARYIPFGFNDVLRTHDVDFLRSHGNGKFVGITELEGEDTSIIADVEPVDNDSSEDCPGLELGAEAELVKDELADEDIHLDNLLADEPDESGDFSTSEDIPADWLPVPTKNGDMKLVHKASILACMFKSGATKLSADRLLRVRGYTKDFKREEIVISVGEEMLRVKNMAISVIQTSKKQIVPVMFAVTSLLKAGKLMLSVDVAELRSERASDIQVTGQVLSAACCEFSTEMGKMFGFVWDGGYLQFTSPTRSSQATRQASISAPRPRNGYKDSQVLPFPSHLVYPLNEGLIPVNRLPDGITKQLLEAVNHKNAAFMPMSTFYEHVERFNTLPDSAFEKLKNAGTTPGLPYRNESGIPCIINDATQALTSKQIVTDSGKVECHQCGNLIHLADGRAHVSEHILLKMLGLQELGLREEISNEIVKVCGFCGKLTCGPTSMKPHSRTEVTSLCPRMHSFSLGHASRSSKGHPSTNVPVGCPFCPASPSCPPPVFWKYSMFFHIQQAHSRYWDSEAHQPRNLPPDLLNNLQVTLLEINSIRNLHPRISSACTPLIALPFDPNITGLRRKDPPTADVMVNSCGMSSSRKKPRLSR